MNIEKHLEVGVRWIRVHHERFWAITGTVLLSLLFCALLIHHQQTESDDAWSQLGGIQSKLTQGRLEEAHKGLDSWEPRFQGSDAATYAKFLKGDLLYRTSDYVQASHVYGDIVQTGRPELTKPL